MRNQRTFGPRQNEFAPGEDSDQSEHPPKTDQAPRL